MAVIGEMDVFTVNKDKQYEVVDRKSRQSIEKINKDINNSGKGVTAGKVWKSTNDGAGWADSDSMSDNQSGGVDVTINGVKRTLQKYDETSDSMADNESGGVDITIGGTKRTVAKQADLKEIEKSQNELKGDLVNVGNAIGTRENDIELSFINGKIINHSGVISDNQYHGISNEINVIPHEKYKIKIKTTSSPSYCAFYDENNNVVESLYDKSLGTSSWVYLSTEVTVPKNASKMILCGNPNDQREAYVKKISYYDIQNEFSEINNKIDYTIEEIIFEIEEGLINCRTGKLGSNSSFVRTKDFIKVNSLDEFYYSGTIYNYGGIYGYDSDYNPIISILDGIPNESTINADKMLLNIPENVSYIKACSMKNTSYTFSIHKKVANIKNQIANVNNQIADIRKNENLFENKGMSTIALFEKIAIIGDSYSSGAVYGDNVGTQGRHNGMSWGKILARRNGIECTLYTQPALTTKWWLEGDGGAHPAQLPIMLSDEPKNLYLIMLGINDTKDGSIDDCKTDWTQNADTFYGNYGKVIGNIKAHAPNAKIVCIKPPFGGKSDTSFNIIKDIADLYNVPCISSYDDDYFSSEFYTSNMSTSHPIGVTYAGMALAFERLFDKCVVENVTYFRDYNGND